MSRYLLATAAMLLLAGLPMAAKGTASKPTSKNGFIHIQTPDAEWDVLRIFHNPKDKEGVENDKQQILICEEVLDSDGSVYYNKFTYQGGSSAAAPITHDAGSPVRRLRRNTKYVLSNLPSKWIIGIQVHGAGTCKLMGGFKNKTLAVTPIFLSIDPNDKNPKPFVDIVQGDLKGENPTTDITISHR